MNVLVSLDEPELVGADDSCDCKGPVSGYSLSHNPHRYVVPITPVTPRTPRGWRFSVGGMTPISSEFEVDPASTPTPVPSDVEADPILLAIFAKPSAEPITHDQIDALKAELTPRERLLADFFAKRSVESESAELSEQDSGSPVALIKYQHEPAEVLTMPSDSFTFFAVGDFGEPTKEIIVTAEVMGKYPVKPAFILGLGDNFYPSGVYSVDDDVFITYWYNIFLAAYSQMQVPWFNCLGNHDYRGDIMAQIHFQRHKNNHGGYWRLPAMNYTFSVNFSDKLSHLCTDSEGTVSDNIVDPAHIHEAAVAADESPDGLVDLPAFGCHRAHYQSRGDADQSLQLNFDTSSCAVERVSIHEAALIAEEGPDGLVDQHAFERHPAHDHHDTDSGDNCLDHDTIRSSGSIESASVHETAIVADQAPDGFVDLPAFGHRSSNNLLCAHDFSGNAKQVGTGHHNPTVVEFFELDTNGVQFSVRNTYPETEFLLKQFITQLDVKLAASTAKWKIVFGHHPLYTKGKSHGELGRRLGQSEYVDKHGNTAVGYGLEDVLVRNKVDAYITGHEHKMQYHYHRGIHHFVSGAAGHNNRFYGGIDEATELAWVDSQSSNGFLRVDVTVDQLICRFISNKMETLKEVVIEKQEKNDGCKEYYT
jgi:hypothetical protein